MIAASRYDISGNINLILIQSFFQSISELTMVKLSVGMATGATYLGAKAAGKSIPRNFQDNVEKFFHYKS